MKAHSLFSFLLVLLMPSLLVAQEEQHADKIFLPSPVGLEISYDDGDTYYYYNNHPQGKKKPLPVPYVPPKKQQTTTPSHVQPKLEQNKTTSQTTNKSPQPLKQNLRRHDDADCHHYNENHWTYEDDNDTMIHHRRCWLYRDKRTCRRSECCWFQDECHGCHDD